jgi:hypothetical protein
VHIFPYIYFLFLKTASLLKLRLRCKACHAEERAAFRSTHPTPQNQLHLQIALAEKFAVVYCDGYAGLRLKTPPTH